VVKTKRADYSKEVAMKRVWFLVGLVSIVLFMGGPVVSASAQAQKPLDIEQRIANQEKRITQAVQAKELTPDDAKMLQGNVAKIKEESTRLKAENKLTKEARGKLNASLDQNSELINQKRQTTAKASPATPAKPAPTGPGAEVKPAVTAPPPAQQTGTPTPPAPKAPAASVKVLTPNPPDPMMQQGIANQQKRIDEGLKNGQLTLNESKAVQANLNAIRDEDNTLRAQGQLTNEQKDRLLKALDQNNKMITDKKSNPVRDMGKDINLAQRLYTLQERYVHQQARINEGIRSKELSPDEAKLLQDNLNFIKNQDARVRAAGGGALTNPQKDELHRLLDQNSDMIYNKKHNPVKTLK
jgi:hypothetical protein